ncbi:MAG TPA: type II secretion system protein [Terriglobales bacterium]|nr:type II secretion system protein [Terriglobales bacterium]
MSARKMRGFSVIEMMIVVAIMMIVMGTAFIQIAPALKNSKSETALQTTLGQMRRAHELAVDRRTVYRVSFNTPRTIQLDQVNIDPATLAKTFVLQSKIDLPSDMSFTIASGIPTASTKVPEGYGNGTVAIDFDRDYAAGGTEVYFQRDGRALDASNRINNGLVYMCRTSDYTSCKAVSLVGATGRSKGWRLNPAGNGWIQ